jgi:hypothetical protein
VSEDFHGLIELLDLKRLFQNRDGTDLQDAVEHVAVRITGDHDNIEVRVDFFRRSIDLIASRIRELKIEEHQIKFLSLQTGDRIFGRPDDDATKSDLLEKGMKDFLELFVIVNDQHRRLALLVLTKDIPVERGLLDPPSSPDLNGRNLAPPDNKPLVKES